MCTERFYLYSPSHRDLCHAYSVNLFTLNKNNETKGEDDSKKEKKENKKR